MSTKCKIHVYLKLPATEFVTNSSWWLLPTPAYSENTDVLITCMLFFVCRPCSIYQYSNMAPRLSGHMSICGVVFFVSKCLLGIEKQKNIKRITILTWKPRSHVRIATNSHHHHHHYTSNTSGWYVRAHANSFHLAWSFPIFSICVHKAKPSLHHSLSTIRCQVVLGVPLLLLPSGLHVKDTLALLIFSGPRTRHNHLHCLSVIMSETGIIPTSVNLCL